MNVLKCVVCRSVLPEFSTSSICEKLTCKETVKAKQHLYDRIEAFTVWWEGKTPNEENYKAYLEFAGLEKMYTDQAIFGEHPPKFSRRAWYTLNVIQPHHEWPDEFGRLRSEILE